MEVCNSTLFGKLEITTERYWKPLYARVLSVEYQIDPMRYKNEVCNCGTSIMCTVVSSTCFTMGSHRISIYGVIWSKHHKHAVGGYEFVRSWLEPRCWPYQEEVIKTVQELGIWVSTEV